jgi:hypothetical protein
MISLLSILRDGNGPGWIEFRFGWVGLGNIDQKKLSGHESGSGRFGSDRVKFQVEHYQFF